MSLRKHAWASAMALWVVAAACAGHAEGERVVAAGDIPRWPGQWEVDGATPAPSGGYVESFEATLREMKAWGPPPYTPQARRIFDLVAKQVREASGHYFRTGLAAQPIARPRCSFGFPALMLHSPLMFEILATPEETALIFSAREIRHVYTDGRPHTAPEDLFPTIWGDSIGHWEGQALVIETIGVSGIERMAAPGIVAIGGDSNALFELIALFSPHTRYVERIRMVDPDHLENQMTIIDPRVFTKPWQITRRYSRVKTLNRMIHEDCEGEDRNPIVDGQYSLAPPPPPPPRLPPPFEDPPGAIDTRNPVALENRD